jgi:hypothetical protein
MTVESHPFIPTSLTWFIQPNFNNRHLKKCMKQHHWRTYSLTGDLLRRTNNQYSEVAETSICLNHISLPQVQTYLPVSNCNQGNNIKTTRSLWSQTISTLDFLHPTSELAKDMTAMLLWKIIWVMTISPRRRKKWMRQPTLWIKTSKDGLRKHRLLLST